ncbi:MAG: sigma-54 dependent transcriptional regulator [Polyangia bacterium]
MSEETTLSILLVDDEPAIRLSVGDALREAGHHVKIAADGSEALAALAAQPFDLMITDIHLPKATGLELFRHVCTNMPTTDVILITAYGAIEDAVNALKHGAKDYLLKPFDIEELVVRVARIAEQRLIKKQLSVARSELAAQADESGLIGRTPLMARLRDRIATLAASDAPVLITGETGTGKELVARRLHELSPRRGKPFIAVNCAAFPETLIEGELFGHERGAFTGAVKGREGRFKAAHGGTLFLDEVAEIPLTAQVKLLRVLQEGTIEPLGTNTPIRVDVRVISATHRNIKRLLSEEKFREDLYYRLNVLDISLPPLRERTADIPVLIKYFLEKLTKPGEKPPTLTPRAYSALTTYHYPGNVRELKHAIEHAVVLSRGQEIDLEHLPADVRGSQPTSGSTPPQGTVGPLSAAMKEFERAYLLRALDATQGKKAAAARQLGISRKNLWEKLRSHDISQPEAEE